jgi:hypothetical protein
MKGDYEGEQTRGIYGVVMPALKILTSLYEIGNIFLKKP